MSLQEIKPDYIPVKKSQPKQVDRERLRKICSNFEAIFVGKLLKSMRQSSGNDSLFGDGLGAQTYQSMFDSKLSEKIAQDGGFGVGRLLFNELSSRLHFSEDKKEMQPVSLKKLVMPPAKSFSGKPIEQTKGYHEIIKQAAKKYRLPVHLLYGVIAQESNWDPRAVSQVGAKGLMQLMDATAADMGVRNPFDPAQNIHGGAKYLRQQLDQFQGNVELALAAYNAGPGNVEKYGGMPPFKETQDYVEKVLSHSRKYNQLLSHIGNESD
ncbi:MAG: transglycosylase SLT domain-containing protein [Actinobacteria bacterium]|nr:transglycosylase SLT domain-containing protein [Actinomycetota bacterium]